MAARQQVINSAAASSVKIPAAAPGVGVSCQHTLTDYVHHVSRPSPELPPNVPPLLDASRVGTVRHFFLAASSSRRVHRPSLQIVHYTRFLLFEKQSGVARPGTPRTSSSLLLVVVSAVRRPFPPRSRRRRHFIFRPPGTGQCGSRLEAHAGTPSRFFEIRTSRVCVCGVNGSLFLDCARQRHRLATQQVRR